MSLLERLKTVLGFGRPGRGSGEEPVAVTVERDAETDESAPPQSAAADSDAPSEPDATSSRTDVDEPVTDISGIGPAYSERLAAADIHTVSDLGTADAATVAAETDLAEGRLQNWIAAAREHTDGD